MMKMPSGLEDQAKQRMVLAKALCKEVRGEGLNLGKKISVPKDVMMEELNLPSNRGSRMFQERQRRVERFTLENTVDGTHSNVAPEAIPPSQTIRALQGEKENEASPLAGKHSLVLNLQKTVAKKGSPGVLAPGYSGPIKEIPHEKFNSTVIPKSYSSPWREALGDNQQLLATLKKQLPQPPQSLQPANYRCFNRSAMPFGGAMVSKRVIPAIGFEAFESNNLRRMGLNGIHQRPSFNRAPRGWGMDYYPESNQL